jgi:hypothetical protein
MTTHLRRAAAAAASATEPASGSIGPDSTPAATIADASEDDPLLTQAQIRRIVPVSDMTLWRWRRAGILPPPIVIRGRNYTRRSIVLRALQAAAESAEEGAA